MNWEYRVEAEFVNKHDFPPPLFYATNLLNTLGAEGWELTATVTNRVANEERILFIFKRPKA